MGTLLDETIRAIERQDAEWRARAHERLEHLTMPYWALGRLMDLAEELAGMTRSMQPPVARRTVVTMAADHGVVDEGVSKYPQAVTAQMVYNFVRGGAGINAIARTANARVVVVDMGVAGDLSDLASEGRILSCSLARGTQNIARSPAMSYEEAIGALEAGIQIAQRLAILTDVFATGDMGIGNTTPSAAIACALAGCTPQEATGRGTGIDNEALQQKIAVVRQSIETNRPKPGDGIDVLAKVGGFEIGGIAGLILGAASLRRPVVVDGFISTAGALIAQALAPASVDYMIASHESVERGHQAMLKKLGKRPLMNLEMRLGEGTGAALALCFVDAAARLLTEVATFEEASVSRAER